MDEQAGYRSVLVAFEDGGYSASVVRTAVRLAARRRRGIHVLVTITVPTDTSIDAPLPDEEARAQEIVEQARVLGGRQVTGRCERVRPGQAGRRIVETAQAMQARAIVAPRPRRRPGSSLFGRTLETVLEARPCRVIIESEPTGDGSERQG